MSTERVRFKAEIDGKEYTIVGKKSRKHLQTASQLVSDQLESLKKMTKGLDTESRAILLALNTMSQILDKEKQIIELEEKIARLSDKQSS